VAAAGASFPLEREEAVDACAVGAALGAEASEAAAAGETASDLALLGGGSMKASSLQERFDRPSYEKNVKRPRS
jgi:hypothetical protein